MKMQSVRHGYARRLGVAIGVTSLSMTLGLASAQASVASAYTLQHVLTGHSIGQNDNEPAPPITGVEFARSQAKHKKAAQFYKAYVGAQLKAHVTPSATAVTYAASSVLAVSYQVQTQSSWCGPTTLAIMAGYKGVGWTGSGATQQNQAASLLGVTPTGPGTPWYGSDNVPNFPGSSWYPIQDAMNYQLYSHGKGTWYAVVALAYSPSSADIAAFKQDLMFDTTPSASGGFPVASAEYAGVGAGVGKQPRNIAIQHWFASNGYQQSGNVTVFSDPGWGGGSASTDATTRIVIALGGRGYIW